MEFILFILGVVISLNIMRMLLGDKVKPIFIAKNRVKYEIFMAIYVISITVIIIQIFDKTSFNYFSGIALGIIQGFLKKIFVYKKEEQV